MRIQLLLLFGAVLASTGSATAGDGQHPWSGDWYLKLGASGFLTREYAGSSTRILQASPLVSLGKTGSTTRFSSRNDNMSYGFLDGGAYRVGVVGKFIIRRDDNDSDDLKGLAPIKFGGEVGGFAEVYPSDWLRLRAEIRQGIRSHHGVVTEIAADGFTDLTPKLRLSGGPRMTAATRDYFDAYYGVDKSEAAASGLGEYKPHGGLNTVGVGGALTWQVTDKIETSAFVEYQRLLGSAASSSLVRERGSPNQIVVGVAASYRFGFSLP